MPETDVLLSADELYALAFMAAGIGSGAVMRHAPKVVMPTEEITEGVRELLEERCKIPPPPGWAWPDGRAWPARDA